jgi:hypothetical protein
MDQSLRDFIKTVYPSPWQQFYNSRFRHWPARTRFKTNKAWWAKK